MITIHGTSWSGNCHKLKLLLSQLGRGHHWREVDLLGGDTRTPEFLAKNPNGKVPVLELGDGRVLVESNAILHWLADGSRFLPSDPWQRAQALSWMFFEQYSHEPYIAVARFICGWAPPDSPRRADLPRLRERGHQALAVMERHLGGQRWFTGQEYGGFDLSGYPALLDWLQRVRATPGFVEMPPASGQAREWIALSMQAGRPGHEDDGGRARH
jgi:glutathione S-transferase